MIGAHFSGVTFAAEPAIDRLEISDRIIYKTSIESSPNTNSTTNNISTIDIEIEKRIREFITSYIPHYPSLF
jgi:hypothetical protein